MKYSLLCRSLALLGASFLVGFELGGATVDITVDSPKIAGQKALVRLEISNYHNLTVESIRASAFLMESGGKMAAQDSRWIVGGNGSGTLEPGKTNVYYFVFSAERSLPTNLTAKVTVGRLVLEGGRLGDVEKDVTVSTR